MSSTISNLIARIDTTEAKIAARLGIDQQRLWNYKTGKRPMPDHQVAHLATLAGIDPRRALGDYAYERLLGKTKGRTASIVIAIGMALSGLSWNTASEARSGTHNVQQGKRRRGLQEGGGLASLFCMRCSPQGLLSC